MLAKTLVVFYVWSLDIAVLSFYQNLFSGIAYSIMSNKTLPYHTSVDETKSDAIIAMNNLTVFTTVQCLQTWGKTIMCSNMDGFENCKTLRCNLLLVCVQTHLCMFH